MTQIIAPTLHRARVVAVTRIGYASLWMLPARRPLLLTAFLVMIAGRVAGAAFSPALLAHAPLLLLLLCPAIAYLVLVAALVSPAAYYAVALPMSALQCGLGYLLGRAQHEDALRWLVSRGLLRQGSVDTLLPIVRRAAPLMLLLLPGPLVCLLAGVAGCRPRVFWPLMLLAQLAWVVACQRSGVALLGWLALRRAQLTPYALPLTLVTITLAAAIHLWRRRQRPPSR